MGLSISKRVLQIFVMSIVAMTVAVGCGDGKSKKRARVPKTAAGQKPAAPGAKPGEKPAANDKTEKPGAKKPGTDTPATTDKPASTETDADRKKAAEESAKQVTIEKRFDGKIEGFTLDGRLMDKHAIPDGTWKLGLVTASLKYMQGSSWMRAFVSRTLNIDGGTVAFSQEPAEGLGASANNPDAAGRIIEGAMLIEVKKDGGAFRAERISFQKLVNMGFQVTTEMNTKGDIKVDMKTTPGTARPDRPNTKASLAALLATNGIDGKITRNGKEEPDHKHSVKEGSKQIDLRIRQLSDTKIRFVFEIMESDIMFRTVVLDYDLVEGSAPAPAAASAPAAAGVPPVKQPPKPDDSAGTAAAPAPAGVPATSATPPPLSIPPGLDGEA